MTRDITLRGRVTVIVSTVVAGAAISMSSADLKQTNNVNIWRGNFLIHLWFSFEALNTHMLYGHD